jgi:anti-anti-sigma regulatory factor
LALAFFSLSVVILVISNGLQLFSNIQSQRRALTSNQQLIAQGAASTVSRFVQEKFSTLETALQLNDLSAMPEPTQRQVLEGLIGLQPSFKRLIFMNTDGTILAQAARLSLEAPLGFTQRIAGEVIGQAKYQQRYIGPVYVDDVTGEPLVLVAVPAIGTLGDVHGALVAEVNLKFMWDLVDRLKVGEAGRAYVVDRRGTLIAFNDTARVLKGESVAQLQVVSDFIHTPAATQATQVRTYTGIEGVTVVGTYVALDTPDWAVVTELPWDEAYRGIIQDGLVSVAIILAIALFSGLLGVFLARRLTVPLVNLMDTATRIAGGAREEQAVVGGPREVASLAAVFNSMTAQLRLALEELEQRVAQRTADLHTALCEVEARANEQARLLEENDQQRKAIRELSVPVLPVADNTLVMPLIGAIDTGRLADIQERALQAIERSSAKHLLLDITGVPVVDSHVAQGLLGIARMTRLLGAEAMLIGIRPEVAQTIVGLGLDLTALPTATDLRAGLQGVKHQL